MLYWRYFSEHYHYTGDTFLSTTTVPPHMSVLMLHNLIYMQLKQSQRLVAHEDSNAEWKTWQVYCLENNNNYVLKFDLKESRDARWFPSERQGKVIPCRAAEDRKSVGTNSGKSGTRILEAESIWSRAESVGGCVKLKTVTEYSWQSYSSGLTTENSRLHLESLCVHKSLELTDIHPRVCLNVSF